jgi:hypothetical protein
LGTHSCTVSFQSASLHVKIHSTKCFHRSTWYPLLLGDQRQCRLRNLPKVLHMTSWGIGPQASRCLAHLPIPLGNELLLNVSLLTSLTKSRSSVLKPENSQPVMLTAWQHWLRRQRAKQLNQPRCCSTVMLSRAQRLSVVLRVRRKPGNHTGTSGVVTSPEGMESQRQKNIIHLNAQYIRFQNKL